MNTFFKYFLAAILLVCMALPQAFAQSNTYYHMFGVPQANQLNPAFQPSCNGYLAMPFLGPLRFQTESNSIGFGDVFQWNNSLNKYVTFMHPQGDKQAFINALEPVNRFRFQLSSNILSTGWRKEQLYFTLDFTERVMQDIAFPKDLAEFMIYGNLNQENFNFSDLAVNLTYFHQLAIGASYNFDDEMQVGIRAKLLLGGATSNTRSSDIGLKTSIDEWNIASDVKVDASIPYLENLPVDQDGYLDVDSLPIRISTCYSDFLRGYPIC